MACLLDEMTCSVALGIALGVALCRDRGEDDEDDGDDGDDEATKRHQRHRRPPLASVFPPRAARSAQSPTPHRVTPRRDVDISIPSAPTHQCRKATWKRSNV